MNILDQIIADKYKEVALKKLVVPTSQLEQSFLFGKPTISLVENLKNSASGIIAEYKRRSPSKSVINNSVAVETVVKGYENAGVCGISVLTDGRYFGGSSDDLLLARASVKCPLLRKEFIVDEYQILEAKSFGADIILLIAAVLTSDEIEILSAFAKSLQLEVLLEIHNVEELEKSIFPTIDMIGVNNRNLKTFEVSLETSKDLASRIPNDFVKISESGIGNPESIKELQAFGYRGFLMGEHFMKTDNPGKSAQDFINQILK